MRDVRREGGTEGEMSGRRRDERGMREEGGEDRGEEGDCHDIPTESFVKQPWSVYTKEILGGEVELTGF